MSHGMVVRNAAGSIVFDQNTLSLRVIAIASVSLNGTAPVSVNIPEARPHHMAFVQAKDALYDPYSPYGFFYYGQAPVRATARTGSVLLEKTNLYWSGYPEGIMSGGFDVYVLEIS